MVETADRGAPSNLRGWLSDVYLPALLSRDTEALARRVGVRATLDEPLFGLVGAEGLASRLSELAGWLAERHAAFERSGFVMGSDRDVTYGVLTLAGKDQKLALPVAVGAERRREREVAIRVYHSTRPIPGKRLPRAAQPVSAEETAVPPPVAAYLDALERGDLAAVVASFEDGAVVVDGTGAAHMKDGGGSLEEYFGSILRRRDLPVPIALSKNARADDGRACALEYAVVRIRGREVTPQPGFGLFERGASGLLHSLRLYDDLDSLARASE
jgi:hypothetical protein